MSYPGARKTAYNDESPIIPVAYATMTSISQDELIEASEHPPVSTESVQVMSIIDESNVPQSSSYEQDHHPLQQEHPSISPILATTTAIIDPTVIQVVTFDEPPSAAASDMPFFSQQEPDSSMQQESTPLLLHSPNGNDTNGRLTTFSPHAHNNEDDEEERAQCHDMIWAILFYSHIAAIVYAGLYIAPQGYALIANNDFDLEKLHDFMQKNFVDDKDFTNQDLDNLTHFLNEFQAWWAVYPFRISWLIFACSVLAFSIGLMKTVVRGRHAVCFVSSSIVMIGVMSSLILFGIAMGLFVMLLFSDKGLFGFVLSVVLIIILTIYIRKRLWPKIHFAALNLEIALVCLADNLGTYVWVIGCVKATLAWICFWCYTVLGLIPYVTTTKCPEFDDPNNNDTCSATNGVVLAMLLSLYWTLSHVGATIQVYVAGVMGTWCFDKESARGFCSSAVTSSAYRSLTFSSGPIAFGSLFQASAKVLRSILSHYSNNHRIQHHGTNHPPAVYDPGDDCRCCCCCFGLCGLVLECLSEVFGDVLDYFSQWAYVFVGINGTSYLESGKAVAQLFQTRGWTALITDRVVALVLGVGMLNGGIGTGLAAMGMEQLVTWIAFGNDNDNDPSQDLPPPSYIFGPLKNIPLVSFILGFLVGCVVSAIMMNVIQGAVNTLIVCWAESPESFSQNHKHWADKMTLVWGEAFPESQLRQMTRPGVPHPSGRYGATDATIA